MSIAKNEIVDFVNDQLNRSKSEYDDEIRSALKDISMLGDFLMGHDDTQTITAADKYFAEPDNYKSLAAIILNDGTYDSEPLKPTFGRKGYLESTANQTDSNRSTPTHYDHWLNRFYVAPWPLLSYTVKIDYYMLHPEDIDTILLPDELRYWVYALTTAKVASQLGEGFEKQTAKWFAITARERKKWVGTENSQPRFTRGSG